MSSSRRRSDRRRRGDRGATVVEFAMAAPALMLMLVGLFTGANFVNRQLQVNHAASDGARFGASLDVSSSWATLVKQHIETQEVGDFSDGDICVALVTGSGNSPAVVTTGTALDPSTRVVVRIASKGAIDWVVGSSAQSWTSTSTSLWEPVSRYSGSGVSATGGVTSASFTSPSTSAPADTTCTGTTGNDQYAYVPAVTKCTAASQNVDLSSVAALSAFTRTGTGGSGTTLTETKPATGCNNPITIAWTVADMVSDGSAPAENLTTVTNDGTAPLSWMMGQPSAWTNPTPQWSTGEGAVLVSNLENSCPGGLCTDGERGHVTLTLTFSRPVTSLSFDLVHLEHDQSGGPCNAWRYETAYLAPNPGSTISSQVGAVSNSANIGQPPPAWVSQGDGTSASPWTPNVQPGNALPTCNQGWSTSVQASLTGSISSMTLYISDRNGNDGSPSGWSGNPTNGTANLQAGIANMKFTYT